MLPSSSTLIAHRSSTALPPSTLPYVMKMDQIKQKPSCISYLMINKSSRSELAIDYVMRFEHLESDFDYVCDKLEIPLTKLPKKNASNSRNYTEYYDQELIEMVAKTYSQDISLFEYKYES
jgi:Sulfotransferase family